MSQVTNEQKSMHIYSYSKIASMRQVPCKHYKEKTYKEFEGLEILSKVL